MRVPMHAPTYVISFLLIATGLVGFFTQTPSVSIVSEGELAGDLQLTLLAEDALPLEIEYSPFAWHTPMEQAAALRDEIIIRGNRENHDSWYVTFSDGEKEFKLGIFHKKGLSLSANDWSGIKKSSGDIPTGALGFDKSWTALIPAILGLVLIGCVRWASTRKYLMIVALLIALVGIIFPAKMAWDSYEALDEVKEKMTELARNPATQPPSPVRFLSQGVTAALCFFFAVLCIQSLAKTRKQLPIAAPKANDKKDGKLGRRDASEKEKKDGADKQGSTTKSPWLKEKSSRKITRGKDNGDDEGEEEVKKRATSDDTTGNSTGKGETSQKASRENEKKEDKPETSKEPEKTGLGPKPSQPAPKSVDGKPSVSTPATGSSNKPEKLSSKGPTPDEKKPITLGKTKDGDEKKKMSLPKPPRESKKKAPDTPEAKKDDATSKAENTSPEKVKNEDGPGNTPARLPKLRMTKPDPVRDPIRLNRPKPTKIAEAKDEDGGDKTDTPTPPAPEDRPKPSPDGPKPSESGTEDENKPSPDETGKIPSEKSSDSKSD